MPFGSPRPALQQPLDPKMSSVWDIQPTLASGPQPALTADEQLSSQLAGDVPRCWVQGVAAAPGHSKYPGTCTQAFITAVKETSSSSWPSISWL